MKRLHYQQQVTGRGVEVNVSPLIDVVFLLLIFFVVTAVFVEETGVDVRRPTATSAQDLEKQSVLLALTADGDIVYGGRRITLNGVRTVVSQQMRDVQRPVIVLGDERAQMGTLVDILDECRLAGATQVSIAARRE